MENLTYSPQFREIIAKEFLEGQSATTLANKYGINRRSVYRWANKYEIHGIEAFIKGNGNASYTKELQLQCVTLFLTGKMSATNITAKYNLSSEKLLSTWVKRYNANRELKDYCPKPEVYMAEARRKTTIEERKEIVEYCINHNRNYKETASIYDVSYNQVYSWVKKYDEKGEDGLVDKRGHHKSDDELNELERLRRENKRLKRKLEEEQMLVELLKKVKEFEGM